MPGKHTFTAGRMSALRRVAALGIVVARRVLAPRRVVAFRIAVAVHARMKACAGVVNRVG